MPRGTQLGVLLRMLRAECGHSTNPASSANSKEMLLQIIQRVQRRLYLTYDWPFARYKYDEPLFPGQRYYTFDTDLDFERVVDVWYKGPTTGDEWYPVEYGIGPEHLNQYNSDADERSDPVWRWQARSDGAAGDRDFEVWPIPEQNGTLRLVGTKKLSPLVADSDRADLDDDLIVLFAAAEVLTRQKSADANAKLQQANDHLRQLRAATSKREMVTLGGAGKRQRFLRPGIDYIR